MYLLINMRHYLPISILLLFSFLTAEAQVTPTTESTQTETVVRNGVGQIGLAQPESIVQKYTYNPALDRYVYTEKLGKYDLTTPLFLTVKEYEKLVLRERMSSYYKINSMPLAILKAILLRRKKHNETFCLTYTSILTFLKAFLVDAILSLPLLEV